MTSTIVNGRSKSVRQLLHDAAAKAEKEGDPWGKHNIPNIPAERIIRHVYNAETRLWSTDETIVKIEQTPFTHGAMRFCYRMKMMAQAPNSRLPNRFHSYGWKHASNYVAKAYMKDGEIDVSKDAKLAVQNDITLQHESQYWAEKFNSSTPPKSILFIQAYAIEFPDRPGCPWMPIERFISGTGSYGAGFVKHNTNSGFVDQDLSRITPQLFSAHSFYASEGDRLVVDIQGVGDLYTDPQVLSSDYRFGDGDLGPRGMALFFKTFLHSSASRAMGIPFFPLSKTEAMPKITQRRDDDKAQDIPEGDDEEFKAQFAKMDSNRNLRKSVMPQKFSNNEENRTMRTSNITNQHSLSASFQISMKSSIHAVPRLKDASEVEAVAICLERSHDDFAYDEISIDHQVSDEANATNNNTRDEGMRSLNRRRTVVRHVSAPMSLSELTMKNLGRVHYQLAVLHGIGRFQDEMPEKGEDDPTHDAFAVLFHLSYAAALRCAPACLAIARVQAGLDTVVSNLITAIVPVNFEAAKVLLQRTMESISASSKPKAAAGCLLLQIYNDEEKLSDEQGSLNNMVKAQIITETLQLMEDVDEELREKDRYASAHFSSNSQSGGLNNDVFVGDRVEANYNMEGAYYPGVVIDRFDDECSVQVRYDDDESTEKVKREDMRLIVASNATETNLGGPLSDNEIFGGNGETDDKMLLQAYDLKAELAHLKEKTGDLTTASRLYGEAAEGAIADGKMNAATEWSLKAENLEG